MSCNSLARQNLRLIRDLETTDFTDYTDFGFLVKVGQASPLVITKFLNGEIGCVKPGTDKSVPTVFVISFVGTVLTVPAQSPLKL